jgi:putative cardiolipin synthase
MLLFSGCAALRPRHTHAPEWAFDRLEDTTLGAQFQKLTTAHPGQSGFHLLESNLDSLAIRLQLADAAERTIDLQYYLMHDDRTGRLLMERLVAAADRGVRVRLLIDDHHVRGRDFHYSTYDVHTNIEVRIFNAFYWRQFSVISRPLEYLSDFSRLTRRMHNKLFCVDNAVAITGGRNVGDEYFEARPDFDFQDLDLIAAGPVVRELSLTFDDYWNSEWAIPASKLAWSKAGAKDLVRERRRLIEDRQASQEWARDDARSRPQLAAHLADGTDPMIWASAHVICDPPVKVVTETRSTALHIGPELYEAARATRDEMLLISPYFVPGDDGLAFAQELRKEGVRIRLLTNSMASNDSPIAHVGYERYRNSLIRDGIELFELKPSARLRRRQRHYLQATTRASLHAKAFVFDRHTVYIGSVNLSPRSSHLNTELGIVVESPELAQQIVAYFEEATQPRNSHRLSLERAPSASHPKDLTQPPRDWPVWISEENGREVRHHHEPDASAGQQVVDWLLSILSMLPVEDQM